MVSKSSLGSFFSSWRINSTFCSQMAVWASPVGSKQVPQLSFILSLLFPLPFTLAVFLLEWLIRSVVLTHTNLFIEWLFSYTVVFSSEQVFSFFVVWIGLRIFQIISFGPFLLNIIPYSICFSLLPFYYKQSGGTKTLFEHFAWKST